MKTSKLKFNPKNPRTISDAALDKLCKSIQSLPQMMEYRPIVYDPKTFHVLGGNQRLQAIRKLGMKEIPDTWVKSADALNELQQREFILRDNAAAGEWDIELLEAEFADFQFEDFGIEIPTIKEGDKHKDIKAGDVRAPNQEITTDIQYRDIYSFQKAGKELHRLMCGNSIEKDDVEALMNGEYSELLFTSPPYSDMREYEGDKDLSINYLIQFIPTWKPHCNYQAINLGLQRKDGQIYPYWDEYIATAQRAGYLFLAWNVWVKPNAGSVGNQSAFFPISHEWIFIFGNQFKDIYRTEPRKTNKRERLTTMRNADGQMKYHTAGVQLELSEMGSVVTCPYETGAIRSLHPATFSVELPSAHIRAITAKDQIITDPFLGAGTTMVAAHQLGRRCFGMELEPKYCQVTINRMKEIDPELEVVKL